MISLLVNMLKKAGKTTNVTLIHARLVKLDLCYSREGILMVTLYKCYIHGILVYQDECNTCISMITQDKCCTCDRIVTRDECSLLTE